MKLLKWFAFFGFLLSLTWFVDPHFFKILGTSMIAGLVIVYFFEARQKDRQPMATAKSGGWEKCGWNSNPPPPDGTKRPPPPPPPPATRRIDEGVRILTDSENQAACGSPFIPQPTPEKRGAIGFWDLPRAWPDVEDAAGAGLAWARQGAAEEKKDLDLRIRALSGFMRSPHRGFDRLDQAEQGLLRHQCELMQGYSAVLGARIANWRDGGGK